MVDIVNDPKNSLEQNTEGQDRFNFDEEDFPRREIIEDQDEDGEPYNDD